MGALRKVPMGALRGVVWTESPQLLTRSCLATSASKGQAATPEIEQMAVTINRHHTAINRRQITINRHHITFHRRQVTSNRRHLIINRRQFSPNHVDLPSTVRVRLQHRRREPSLPPWPSSPGALTTLQTFVACASSRGPFSGFSVGTLESTRVTSSCAHKRVPASPSVTQRRNRNPVNRTRGARGPLGPPTPRARAQGMRTHVPHRQRYVYHPRRSVRPFPEGRPRELRQNGCCNTGGVDGTALWTCYGASRPSIAPSLPAALRAAVKRSLESLPTVAARA